MTEFFIKLLSAICWVFFFSKLFEAGMIFHFLQPSLHKLPTWIRKPLYQCQICMSFWWCIIFWFVPFGIINFVAIGCGFVYALTMQFPEDEL